MLDSPTYAAKIFLKYELQSSILIRITHNSLDIALFNAAGWMDGYLFHDSSQNTQIHLQYLEGARTTKLGQ